ncbi:hypothetical protein T190115A13A_200023 [Tenacibaculum sp. 190524A02b]|uniref:HTH luxR-type domain-containing protein n=1 Tax=Tenacibaculum vairaonense TaxID=3137860 RepID=A0ABP1FAT7_9FLAO
MTYSSINLFQIASLIQNNQHSFKQICEQLPCYLFINSAINFDFLEVDYKLLHNNVSSLKKTTHKTTFKLDQFIDKESVQQISEIYFEYLDAFVYDKPLAFIQKVNSSKSGKPELLYIRGKVIDRERILSISVPIQNMNLFNHDSLKLLENSMFIKKNLARYKSITKTEIEVCRCLCNGNDIKETAKLLHKSEHTIKNHKNSIYKKMGVSNFFDFYNFSHKFKLTSI